LKYPCPVRLNSVVPGIVLLFGCSFWTGCLQILWLEQAALQPGHGEWEQERVPTSPSRDSWERQPLLHGKYINGPFIHQTTLFKKCWEVKKISQEKVRLRTKISPWQKHLIKCCFPGCHHLVCVMGNNLDVITLQDYCYIVVCKISTKCNKHERDT